MNNIQFKSFIDRVVERPTYIRHFVIDRGLDRIIVQTKVGNFMFDKDGWIKMDNKACIDMLKFHYFPQFTKYFA